MIVSIYFDNGEKIQVECEKATAEYRRSGELITLAFEGLENKKFLYVKLSKVIAVVEED